MLSLKDQKINVLGFAGGKKKIETMVQVLI